MKSRTPTVLVINVLLLFFFTALARQAAADLYVSDYLAGKIYRYASDGVQHTFASLNHPYGLAFDAGNNLYVAAISQHTIYKITPNGRYRVFASDSSLSQPKALAFDSAGNLFVSWGIVEGGIVKITPDGTITPFVDRVLSFGLAFDSAGYLFATDTNTQDVLKISPDGTITSFAHGFHGPWGLAFDPAGNLFVADFNGVIYKVTPEGSKTRFGSAINPTGLSFDHSGYLFVAASDRNGGGIILQFAPDGTESIFATGLALLIDFAIPNSQ